MIVAKRVYSSTPPPPPPSTPSPTLFPTVGNAIVIVTVVVVLFAHSYSVLFFCLTEKLLSTICRHFRLDLDHVTCCLLLHHCNCTHCNHTTCNPPRYFTWCTPIHFSRDRSDPNKNLYSNDRF